MANFSFETKDASSGADIGGIQIDGWAYFESGTTEKIYGTTASDGYLKVPILSFDPGSVSVTASGSGYQSQQFASSFGWPTGDIGWQISLTPSGGGGVDPIYIILGVAAIIAILAYFLWVR